MTHRPTFSREEIPREHLERHAGGFHQASAEKERGERLFELQEQQRLIQNVYETVFPETDASDLREQHVDRTVTIAEVSAVEGVTTKVGVRISGSLIGGPWVLDKKEDFLCPGSGDMPTDDISSIKPEEWDKMIKVSLVYDTEHGGVSHATEEVAGYIDTLGTVFSGDRSAVVGSWHTDTGQYSGANTEDYFNHPVFRLMFSAEDAVNQAAQNPAV